MLPDSIDPGPKSESIWYISKYLAKPGNSGRGSRGYYLLQELSLLGYQVAAIVSDSNHLVQSPKLSNKLLKEKVNGVDFLWVRTIKYRNANSIKRILSWLHFDVSLLTIPKGALPTPSVIIASSLSLTSILPAFLLSKIYGARLVFEVRDIWPLTLVEEGGFSPKNPLIKILAAVERFGYLAADAVVGTMPNLSEHVKNVSRSKAPIFCVPMGYATTMLEADGMLPPEFKKANIPKNRLLVGYAGTVGTTNALENLFECAAEIEKEEEIHFVIVGGGNLLSHYLSQYSSLTNVTFLGAIPQDSVQSVLQQFDVLYLSTFPSKVWDFGQSLNKLIDYMLSGKPILASYSGFPSMVNESNCGTFVPAGDSKELAKELRKLAKLDPIELESMGMRGREWLINNRSFPKMALDYEQILFPKLSQES